MLDIFQIIYNKHQHGRKLYLSSLLSFFCIFIFILNLSLYFFIWGENCTTMLCLLPFSHNILSLSLSWCGFYSAFSRLSLSHNFYLYLHRGLVSALLWLLSFSHNFIFIFVVVWFLFYFAFWVSVITSIFIFIVVWFLLCLSICLFVIYLSLPWYGFCSALPFGFHS